MMGRPRTGAVSPFRDEQNRPRFRVGLTPPPPLKGKQKWWRLPPGVTPAKARATADAWNEQSAENPAEFFPELVHARPSETVAEYSKRWLDERAAVGLTSVVDDRQRMRDHVLPVIGELEIAKVKRGDLRSLVAKLDDKVRAGELGWNTARKCWAIARTLFKDSCASKRSDLVAREDDPSDKVRGPEVGDHRERTYLYPSEFQKLIRCAGVPEQWRRLYALAAYTFSRAGELAALRWDAIDFERGVIHFRQATDRRAKGAKKGTKTGKNRRIPIEPTLRPLLEQLFREATDAYVVSVPVSKRADTLRSHLELAGITRTELFDAPEGVAATWAPLTFHDLRGTGVTWMAQRGDEPLVIQQRAGHDDFKTTQRYLREAEALGKDGVSPFPPLPTELVSLLIKRRRARKPQNPRRFVERDTGFESDAGTAIAEVSRAIPRAETSTEEGTARGNPVIAGGSITGSQGKTNPRAAVLADLHRRAEELAAQGDLAGARLLNEAAGRLLDSPLAAVRTKR